MSSFFAPGGADAHPVLTADQESRLSAYGTSARAAVGDVLFRSGEVAPDLVVVHQGRVDVVRVATLRAPEVVVDSFGPGEFVAELNLLTGQRIFLDGRVAEAGRVTRIGLEAFRRVMAEDPELSDLMLRAFISRRGVLSAGSAAVGIEILGHAADAATMAVRTYAARQNLAHTWVDADSADGAAMADQLRLAASELPAVLMPDGVLQNATPEALAAHLGLTYRSRRDADHVDLAVVGAGPAGLAAAVYGASEGLDTLLLEGVSLGGQAAASSRIENYLGFPSGLSGEELTARAMIQAEKFGARIFSPCAVSRLDAGRQGFDLHLNDGTDVRARAVIIATGARYRSLPIPGWDSFEGAGIYYAATELEARDCGAGAVTVVGGANSSGQAALYLASRGATVTVAARRPDLRATMSAYLVERLEASPAVTIRTCTEVVGLRGDDHLTEVQLADRAGGSTAWQACRGLFCFIGAEPATGWLRSAASALPALSADGFLLTDVAVPDETAGAFRALGRAALPFETSVPGVFAVGDVRQGSMKRVAGAVGEGASAVRSVHAMLATDSLRA